jgi:hypothetical protein
MNGWRSLPATRRQFLLAGAATAGAGAMLPLPAAQAATLLDSANAATCVLHDPRIQLDAALVQRLQSRGARIIALEEDPVRQWRRAAGTPLVQRGTRLLGITRWSDLLLVRGLAAESRRHLRFESQPGDDGVLTWLIA